jgi:hypothetical protein
MTKVRTESLPYKYDIRKQFPKMRQLEAFEGGAEFAAEKGGKFYLIRDGRTMADMIPPDDEDLLDKMLMVLEFDSEDERDQYIRHRAREKIKKVLREGKIISSKPIGPAGQESGVDAKQVELFPEATKKKGKDRRRT